MYCDFIKLYVVRWIMPHIADFSMCQYCNVSSNIYNSKSLDNQPWKKLHSWGVLGLDGSESLTTASGLGLGLGLVISPVIFYFVLFRKEKWKS